MDKTIEVVIVAMVVLITATILLYLVQDSSESFGGFLDSQQNEAQCGLSKTQYRQACDCTASDGSGLGGETDKAASIKQEASNAECSWATDQGLACPDVC